MHYHSHDNWAFPTNFLLSIGSSAVAFLTSTMDPMITGIILPILFFAVGKGIDVALRLYIERRNEKQKL